MSTQTQAKSIRDILSKEEIQSFLSVSNLQGILAITTSWSIVIGSIALLAFYPSIWTFLLAWILVGGRQLAFAILVHEATHYTLHSNKTWNDRLARWLCGFPVWQSLDRYRKHHLKHHAYTGSEKDPDLSLSVPFPVAFRSMVRKLARDLLGITGVKRIIGLIQMDLGYIEYTAAAEIKAIDQTGRTWQDVLKTGVRHLHGLILTQLVLFGIAFALGATWIYVFWVFCYLTTFSVFVRVRSIAEHAAVPDMNDVFLNTRTTDANIFARLTVAPHNVNYHLEHHLLMTVPFYRLPKLHDVLKERGVLRPGNHANGYLPVLRKAIIELGTQEPDLFA